MFLLNHFNDNGIVFPTVWRNKFSVHSLNLKWWRALKHLIEIANLQG